MRALGRLPAMGVPESFVARHPFPGPGLAVRVLGDVTAADHLDVLREVRPNSVAGLAGCTGIAVLCWRPSAVYVAGPGRARLATA